MFYLRALFHYHYIREYVCTRRLALKLRTNPSAAGAGVSYVTGGRQRKIFANMSCNNVTSSYLSYLQRKRTGDTMGREYEEVRVLGYCIPLQGQPCGNNSSR
jgi:hypothetical protein